MILYTFTCEWFFVYALFNDYLCECYLISTAI